VKNLHVTAHLSNEAGEYGKGALTLLYKVMEGNKVDISFLHPRLTSTQEYVIKVLVFMLPNWPTFHLKLST
jgi:hypothetical protein